MEIINEKKIFLILLSILFIVLIRIITIYNPYSAKIKGEIYVTYDNTPVELQQNIYFHISDNTDNVNYNYSIKDNKITFGIHNSEYNTYDFEFDTEFTGIRACFKYLNLNDNNVSNIKYSINYYYDNGNLYADVNELSYLFFKKSSSVFRKVNTTENIQEINDLNYAICLGE